jgi:hypothetical protein
VIKAKKKEKSYAEQQHLQFFQVWQEQRKGNDNHHQTQLEHLPHMCSNVQKNMQQYFSILQMGEQ